MNYKVNKKVTVQNLGLVDYADIWKKQESLFEATIAQKIANRKVEEEEQVETPNYLLFCQHPHVYTLGKSGKEEHLLLDNEHLEQVHAQFYKINRGGDITYHGPGQVVCYPILDLDNFFTDIHLYMRTLEEAVILTLADFGISAGRVEGLTGVWLGHDGQSSPRKICAMGVKSSRWVTMHGLALNVNTDLSYFGNIVPCGISDKAVTSMNAELGNEVDIEQLVKILQNHIVELFKMEMI